MFHMIKENHTASVCTYLTHLLTSHINLNNYLLLLIHPNSSKFKFRINNICKSSTIDIRKLMILTEELNLSAIISSTLVSSIHCIAFTWLTYICSSAPIKRIKTWYLKEKITNKITNIQKHTHRIERKKDSHQWK